MFHEERTRSQACLKPIFAEYQRQVGNWQRFSTGLSAVAASLSAPTDSALGITAAAANPVVSYHIGQHFKRNAELNKIDGGNRPEENSKEHRALHALNGIISAAAADNNALLGGIAAGGAEIIAPTLAENLYGKEAKDLNADEKATVSSLTALFGAAVGAASGNASEAVSDSQLAQGAVDNNYLTKQDWQKYHQKISSCENSQNISMCYRNAQKDLYQTSQNRNKELIHACSENGDLQRCQTLVREADDSRILSKQNLAAFGNSDPKKPIAAFINYHDIPWSNNPTIHYWATSLEFPSIYGIGGSFSIAINNASGEVFIGFSGSASPTKKKISSFGAKLMAGHINNLTSMEKARLSIAISDTIKGSSIGGSACAYYGCIGMSKTIVDNKENERAFFEFGVGTGNSISFGASQMWKIGNVKK